MTQQFSEVFWSFFISSIIGCVIISVRLAYKSKCKTAQCCCLKIERDVEGEEKLDAVTNSDKKENV